jgi:hypothetical protein
VNALGKRDIEKKGAGSKVAYKEDRKVRKKKKQERYI